MGKNGRPLTTNKPQYPPKSLATPPTSVEDRQLFSFRYFDHKKLSHLFGLGDIDSTWYISFIERLRDIERIGNSWDSFCASGDGRNKTLRFHQVDFRGNIKRDNLDWLPKEVLENEHEFPFFQVAVSKARGRLLGFIMGNIFYIVLIDRNHNLLPCRENKKGDKPTSEGKSEYDALLSKIENCDQCKSSLSSKYVIYHYLDDEFLTKYEELLEEHPIHSILEGGILALTD